MDGKSTQVKSDVKEERKTNDGDGASSKTLSFLKMFARAYQAETSLSAAHGAACMN